jgi:hypothetical protein
MNSIQKLLCIMGSSGSGKDGETVHGLTDQVQDWSISKEKDPDRSCPISSCPTTKTATTATKTTADTDDPQKDISFFFYIQDHKLFLRVLNTFANIIKSQENAPHGNEYDNKVEDVEVMVELKKEDSCTTATTRDTTDDDNNVVTGEEAKKVKENEKEKEKGIAKEEKYERDIKIENKNSGNVKEEGKKNLVLVTLDKEGLTIKNYKTGFIYELFLAKSFFGSYLFSSSPPPTTNEKENEKDKQHYFHFLVDLSQWRRMILKVVRMEDEKRAKLKTEDLTMVFFRKCYHSNRLELAALAANSTFTNIDLDKQFIPCGGIKAVPSPSIYDRVFEKKQSSFKYFFPPELIGVVNQFQYRYHLTLPSSDWKDLMYKIIPLSVKQVYIYYEIGQYLEISWIKPKINTACFSSTSLSTDLLHQFPGLISLLPNNHVQLPISSTSIPTMTTAEEDEHEEFDHYRFYLSTPQHPPTNKNKDNNKNRSYRQVMNKEWLKKPFLELFNHYFTLHIGSDSHQPVLLQIDLFRNPYHLQDLSYMRFWIDRYH